MFHFLASIMEVALIMYVSWVALSLVRYFKDIEADEEASDVTLVSRLMLPVFIFGALKKKAVKILKQYGLL